MFAWLGPGWECPCGSEPLRRGRTATPVRTIVALHEPKCPFCEYGFRQEHRLEPGDIEAWLSERDPCDTCRTPNLCAERRSCWQGDKRNGYSALAASGETTLGNEVEHLLAEGVLAERRERSSSGE
jgi:hypothetical protein